MLTKLRRTTTGAVALTALVTGLLLSGAGSASAQHQYGDRLYRGESLSPGESIQRSGMDGLGNYLVWRLVMQTDGNLVEYKMNRYATRVCWASNTYTGSSGNRAVYQHDGNFVVYNPSGQAVWASHTMGHAGETVDINSSGVTYVGHTPISGAC
ncbi:hypothetical protein [Streptomyces sp. NPDC059957]|uniref:hypothetical protein n=1 Tax=Streptomyces sp. NPDC059957 TaxID=3347016 RepID=UPI003668C827